MVEPVGERVDRHADRRNEQAGEPEHHRHLDPTERQARRTPCGERAPGRPRPAAPGRLGDEQHEPEQDERDRERAGGRGAEADLDLGVDLGREGVEAEDLERAELGEQDQGDEEHSSDERGPDLVQRDAEERSRTAEPEPARDVLEPRVGGPERRRDRQVDERVAAERHHEHGAPVPVHGGLDRDPGVGEHEVRDRERQHEHQREEAPERYVGSLDEPRHCDAEHGAGSGDGDREADRVPEELPRQMPEEQRAQSAPPDLVRLDEQEDERQEDRRRDGDRGDQQACRRQADERGCGVREAPRSWTPPRAGMRRAAARSGACRRRAA